MKDIVDTHCTESANSTNPDTSGTTSRTHDAAAERTFGSRRGRIRRRLRRARRGARAMRRRAGRLLRAVRRVVRQTRRVQRRAIKLATAS